MTEKNEAPQTDTVEPPKTKNKKINLTPKKKKRAKKTDSKSNLWKRNWLACAAGIAIFTSLFLPWIGETKGLEQIWQMKNNRKLIEHVYHPQQDTLLFVGHLLVILSFMLIVSIEYWRAKAGKFSAFLYIALSAIILISIGYSHLSYFSSFQNGIWVAISGALLLGVSGSTMFYVKR